MTRSEKPSEPYRDAGRRTSQPPPPKRRRSETDRIAFFSFGRTTFESGDPGSELTAS
jgi:hypothetical protein